MKSAEPPAARPAGCPFCASPDISATGTPAASTYWRCEACGQLWNPGRLLRSAIPPRAYRDPR